MNDPLDRSCEQTSRVVIQQLVPNADEEHLCLNFMAGSIATAHRVHPASWGVTLYRDHVRLNVFRLEVCVVVRGSVRVVLDRHLLGDHNAGFLRQNGYLEREYNSVPGSIGCLIPVSALGVLLPVLQESHTHLIERAAGRVKTRTSFYRKHSPGVISYLRGKYGPEFSDPIYA